MDLLTVRETAGMLKLSQSKVYGMVANGELPYLKIGGAIRICLDDLLVMLAAARVSNSNNGKVRRTSAVRLKHLR